MATGLRVMATVEGKVFDRRDSNPCKEGNALVGRPEWEGCGFKYLRKLKIFSREISIKVYFYYHLAVEFYSLNIH